MRTASPYRTLGGSFRAFAVHCGVLAPDDPGMNVSSISPEAFAAKTLRSTIDFAVARKGLDQVEQQGEAAVSLIKAAADVGKATRGRVSPSPLASESGRRLDVTA